MIVGQKSKLSLFSAHAFLIFFLVVITMPLLLIISISFQKGNLALSSVIPTEFSLEHWKYVLGIPELNEAGKLVKPDSKVLLWFWNSIKIASITSFLIVALSATCAYAFSRMQFRFKKNILNSLLILQMFPIVLALVAIYAILEFIGEQVPALGLGTHWGLILAYLGGVSIYIWMIKGYFDTIPASIEESARVDGATHFQAFIYVLLPMSFPIFAVVFILSFIASIAEYPVASVVLQNQEDLTLAVGANTFLYQQHYRWGVFAATAVLSGIPITTVFLLSQKFLVSGLTSGGIKE